MVLLLGSSPAHAEDAAHLHLEVQAANELCLEQDSRTEIVARSAVEHHQDSAFHCGSAILGLAQNGSGTPRCSTPAVSLALEQELTQRLVPLDPRPPRA